MRLKQNSNKMRSCNAFRIEENGISVPRIWIEIHRGKDDGMNEEMNNNRSGRKLISLKKMLEKRWKQGRGRMNLTGKRTATSDNLPIRLEQKGNDQPLSFDLNEMPHLSITGGTSECQASVIRKILKFWESSPSIEPAAADLAGTLDPETPAISEETFIGKLHEMRDVLERRYDELAKRGLRNTKEYLALGHDDMPLRPFILFGFEKMAYSRFRNEAEKLICKLAQKGRAAGIDLILCSTDAEILNGVIECNFPAKLIFRSNDEKDFSWKSPRKKCSRRKKRSARNLI